MVNMFRRKQGLRPTRISTRNCCHEGKAACVLFVFCIICFPLFAQDQAAGSNQANAEDARQTSRITFGSTAGAPGESVVVPIYVTPGEMVRLGKIQIRVSYVSVNLKFAKLGFGLGAEKGDVLLHSEVNDTKNDKGLQEQTVDVSAEPGQGQKEVPAGLLGFLTLNISKDVKAASINLRASAEAFDAVSKKKIENLRIVSGQISVEANDLKPIVNCYFFSH